MASLSLPASHPNSIHPCLLNACYLGACASNGGSLLTPFKPYFLLRTRQFLEHSLTFADRITDFLWASLILAVFYARERRLVECLTVAEGLVRLALACGLEFPGHSVEEDNSAYPVKYLLPPPNDHSESDDRVRLTYSIYVGSQAYTLLCEYPPILSCDEVWPPPILQEVESHEHQEGKLPASSQQLERSDLHFKVLVSNTFQRTMMFARYVTANNYYGLQDEYVAIETQLRTQQALLPPPRDLHKPPIPPDAPSSSNASIALGHVTLYGIGLILHSSLATYHRESRAKMFECLQGLVDISAHIRDQKYSHLSIVNIFHIMNAVRVIARELRGSKAKENAGLSISHCRSIELLLDFLDDVIKSLPAWVEAPLALKETLEAAANSLSI
ncbi:hypothetical protein DL93DRAFT_2170662 [Clavulina sp. PMI_390]|nr:hypothetical protein DL93DRAFT_2170662 [Clavulina sp. PMI_390]